MRSLLVIVVALAGSGLLSASDESLRWLHPSQGRPVIVSPNGSFAVVAQVEKRAPITLTLRSPHFPRHEQPLRVPPDLVDQLIRSDPVTVTVPADVPVQTYDLVIKQDNRETVIRNAVALCRDFERFRVVHLAGFHVGDPTAPRADARLVHEVNLVGPDLVVCTGDYIAPSHPDRTGAWRRLMDTFAQLDAPVLMACGDEDAIEDFNQTCAVGAIGMVNYGPFQGIVLYDPGTTMDSEQLSWIEQVLERGSAGATFILSHAPDPSPIVAWKRKGRLSELLSARRQSIAWFTDWDASATVFGEVNLLRTLPASATTRKQAPGVPHFRVVDINGDRIVPLPVGATGSIPVGKLRLVSRSPNDGTSEKVEFTFVNTHEFPIAGALVTAYVQKPTGVAGQLVQPPACTNARMRHVADFGTFWRCQARADLPARGSVSVIFAAP